MTLHMALETESTCILFDLLTQFLEQNLESRGSSHFWIEGVKNDLNPFPGLTNSELLLSSQLPFIPCLLGHQLCMKYFL